ncbi:MAG TPA: hypothetical protein VHG08_19280 [Longimicrobium sp.]|nr:hypothetical protein [Longimicrobium sp.]
MNLRPIFFATSDEHPELTADDRLAVAALRDRGFEVAPAVWTRTSPESVDPGTVVVIRSCWDYHLRTAEFERWIAGLESRRVRVVNPPGLLGWNLHKRYLRELEAGGVPVVPTRWIERPDGASLAEILEEAGWAEAVVKPAVSLSAYETWRTSPAQAPAHEARFAALRRAGGVLVQRFMREVLTSGEWSLVFFDGAYSHAVRKLPAPGDFRVQVDHGGTATPATPPDELVAAAARVVRALPYPPVYVRVDGVQTAAGFAVMEVECIDPVLHLWALPGAADRFANAITRAAEVPV